MAGISKFCISFIHPSVGKRILQQYSTQINSVQIQNNVSRNVQQWKQIPYLQTMTLCYCTVISKSSVVTESMYVQMYKCRNRLPLQWHHLGLFGRW